MTHNAINNELWLTDEARLLFNNFIEARRQFSMALIYHYTDVLYHSRHPQDKRTQPISRTETYNKATRELKIHLVMPAKPLDIISISDSKFGKTIAQHIDSAEDLYEYCRFDEYTRIRKKHIQDIIKNKHYEQINILQIPNKTFLYLAHMSKSFIALIETHRKLLFYTLTKIDGLQINKDKRSIYDSAEKLGYIKCADDFLQYNEIRNYLSHPFRYYKELADPNRFVLQKIEHDIIDSMSSFTERWIKCASNAGADFNNIICTSSLAIPTREQYNIDRLLHFVLFYTDYLNTIVQAFGQKKNNKIMEKLSAYNLISEQTVENIMNFRSVRNATAHGASITSNNTINVHEIWTTIVRCNAVIDLININSHLFLDITDDYSI